MSRLKSKSFREGLMMRLKDPTYASCYLKSELERPNVNLVILEQVLRDVGEAHGVKFPVRRRKIAR